MELLHQKFAAEFELQTNLPSNLPDRRPHPIFSQPGGLGNAFLEIVVHGRGDTQFHP
jgi:hypothetical protein